MPILNQKGGNFFFERKLLAEDAARTIVDLCSTRLPKFLKSFEPMRDIQVLSPTKKGECGVFALNAQLQAALNPPARGKNELAYGDKVFREGDKVMHIKNNYQLEWQDGKGGEGQGVSQIVRSKADYIVSIPMKGRVNSLNASNAAAILLYEVDRQRTLAAKE